MPQSTLGHRNSVGSSGAPIWTSCHCNQLNGQLDKRQEGTNGSVALISTTNETFHQLRWVVMSLASLGFGLALIYCDCMAVAIVGMVKAPSDSGDITEQLDGAKQQQQQQPPPQQEQLFHWNNLIQSLVVNSYFIGYAIPQVPLALAANRFGIYKIVIVSYVVAIVSMLLLPIVSITFGWPIVLVIRFIKGLAGAAMYSIPIGMVDYWVPANESTKAITLMMFIGNVGICINPLISGYLTSMHWSLVFYVFASLGIIWLTIWMVIVRDKPEQCWLMSQQELTLILGERAVTQLSIGANNNQCVVMATIARHGQHNHQQNDSANTNGQHQLNGNGCLANGLANGLGNRPANSGGPPWREISSKRNVYILIMIFIVYYGSYLSFINLLPTYFKNNMHLDIKTNALMTFIVQSTSLLASLWGGTLITYLVSGRQWSTRRARLTVSAIAALGSSLMWMVPIMRLADQYNVIAFALNRALHPAMEICLIASVVERWTGQGLSGVMVSLYNCLGNFFSLIISAMSGYMLDYEGNVETIWANLFMVYAIINIISWMLFTLVEQKPANGPNRFEMASLEVNEHKV